MPFLEHLISSFVSFITTLLMVLGVLVHSTPLPHTSLSPISTSTPQIAITSATTSPSHTLTPVQPKPQKKTSSSSAVVPATQQITPTPQIQTISAEKLNSMARAAVVNILCTTETSGDLEPITGSGTLIDPRGIILTNAHVAQFFLLHNYPFPGNVNCIIRTGSPAQARYTAELLYLPKTWVDANADQITKTTPTGTGENDYALLRITGTTDGSPLPDQFPYLPLSYSNPQPSDPMFLASYPAGFLSGIAIQNNLYMTTTYANVGNLYVFNSTDNWIDLFSVPGTVASQGGSSGGAAINRTDGSLAGIIVTDTNASTTAQRDLRALAIEHIEHSLMEDGYTGIPDLLTGDVAAKAQNFNSTIAPLEIKELVNALNSN